MGRPERLGPPKPKIVVTPDREELAWAAGFWDGEGCTTTQRHKNSKNIHLSVSQVFLPNLERFQRAVGGLGKIYGPTIQPNRRPIYCWMTGKFEHAQAVMAMLWSFLTQEKRDQYKRVLAEVRATPNFGMSHKELQAHKVRLSWISRKANKDKEL